MNAVPGTRDPPTPESEPMSIATVDHERPGAGSGSPLPASAAGISRALLATVVLMSVIAPLATDMYVPAFPGWARTSQPEPPSCS